MDKTKYAFPSEDDEQWYYGMTLREYYAGQALAGLLAQEPRAIPDDRTAQIVADAAVRCADALIVALRK